MATVRTEATGRKWKLLMIPGIVFAFGGAAISPVEYLELACFLSSLTVTFIGARRGVDHERVANG